MGIIKCVEVDIPPRTKITWLIVGFVWISVVAFAQPAPTRAVLAASDLLTELLSPQLPDRQWSAAAENFESLSPTVALPILFREIAKGVPNGYSYAAYNCFDPVQDRKVNGWGQFCVVSSLWCKQLSCTQRHNEVSKVLLELWANPISEYGQMVLLEGLCGNPDAKSKIAILFRDKAANMRLRTHAAACLLRQDEPMYHSQVVDFAEKVPITFSSPGLQPYSLQLRRVLFDELASPTHSKSSVDAAVVRLGFGLMMDEAEQAKRYSGRVSDYGQFLYAERLNAYLGTAFEPRRQPPVYAGSDANERFWHDTAKNALVWWSNHKEEYR